MDLRERVYSVLLVSASEKFNRAFYAILPETRYTPILQCGSVAEARQRLLERCFDIAVINTPLPDAFGTGFAQDLSSESGLGVLLFVKNDFYGEICAKMSAWGVMTVAKPAGSGTVLQSMQLLGAMRERMRRAEQKAATLEEKMAEIRLVNRAKWLLIEKENMHESEAHRLIEKQAMDRCITRRAVAEEIIALYNQA